MGASRPCHETAQVPESFECVMGCEVRERVVWLPAALPGAAILLGCSAVGTRALPEQFAYGRAQSVNTVQASP